MLLTVGAATALVTQHDFIEGSPTALIFSIISGLSLSTRNVWQREQIQVSLSKQKEEIASAESGSALQLRSALSNFQ
jgi:hypothetical protein